MRKTVLNGFEIFHHRLIYSFYALSEKVATLMGQDDSRLKLIEHVSSYSIINSTHDIS